MRVTDWMLFLIMSFQDGAGAMLSDVRPLAPTILFLSLLGCAACGSQRGSGHYHAIGPAPGFERSGTAPSVIEGQASYYSRSLAGRKTASGERYDPARLTAAHASLPLGTRLRVTRLPDGPSVDVTVNDRCGYTHGRIIDLSEAAARQLDMLRAGVAPVRIELLGR